MFVHTVSKRSVLEPPLQCQPVQLEDRQARVLHWHECQGRRRLDVEEAAAALETQGGVALEMEGAAALEAEEAAAVLGARGVDALDVEGVVAALSTWAAALQPEGLAYAQTQLRRGETAFLGQA